MPSLPKIILGIDPGTLVMGYALIEASGSKARLLKMDVLKLSAKKDHYERLQSIHHCIQELIQEHRPHEVAIEAPFFGKNVQSMLKLGRAQGVAIAVAMSKGLPVTEYSPKKVKMAVTGNGNADKDQVWKMLQQVLSITSSKIAYLDASDALAVAVCHHFQFKLPKTEKTTVKKKATKKKSSWEEFVKENPGKVRG
ncbi:MULTISPECIES: crossover junction endodeoxyribonuclease RuvC [unclassified Paraflavitalea]|uniref:crossover junction endodeoxyribonuclease RuvC n=1 Tax=unclassified Paraflavitalea TaxID=2798305 RepID=UPI003D341A6B